MLAPRVGAGYGLARYLSGTDVPHRTYPLRGGPIRHCRRQPAVRGIQLDADPRAIPRFRTRRASYGIL
jgi:hypothetical protein